MVAESANLIREGVEKVNNCLERCTNCGKVASQIINHECNSECELEGSNGYNQVDDTRPLESNVLTNRVGVKAYAYHEIDEDGKPVCGGGHGSVSRMKIVSRQKAQERGRDPCKTCARILTSYIG
mgnify:CR=1 FL=1